MIVGTATDAAPPHTNRERAAGRSRRGMKYEIVRKESSGQQ